MPNIPFIISKGKLAAFGIPNDSKFIPKASITFSNNLPGFLSQSVTSPTVLPNHSLPLPATLTAFAKPSPAASLTSCAVFAMPFPALPVKSLVVSQKFFFFLSVPPLNLGSVPFANAGLLLNILCVCAPLITDEPLGRNAVVSLLGVSAILPFG